MDKRTLARFWAKVRKSDDPEGCWLWTGAKNPSGYGWFKLPTTGPAGAHRVSWEIVNGPIPDRTGYHGTVVMHVCDNPSCVNPSHLRLGSQAENLADMRRKGRSATGDRNGSRTCPEAMRRGENHPHARLKRSDVIEIRRLSEAGTTGRAIARRFGLSFQHVSDIVRRKRWKHV